MGEYADDACERDMNDWLEEEASEISENEFYSGIEWLLPKPVATPRGGE